MCFLIYFMLILFINSGNQFSKAKKKTICILHKNQSLNLTWLFGHFDLKNNGLVILIFKLKCKHAIAFEWTPSRWFSNISFFLCEMKAFVYQTNQKRHTHTKQIDRIFLNWRQKLIQKIQRIESMPSTLTNQHNKR